jgi:hypothetical protein
MGVSFSVCDATYERRRGRQQPQPAEWVRCRGGIGHPPVSHGIGPLPAAPAFEANTDSFFSNFFEPQSGQVAPRQLLDGTSFSNSPWQA